MDIIALKLISFSIVLVTLIICVTIMVVKEKTKNIKNEDIDNLSASDIFKKIEKLFSDTTTATFKTTTVFDNTDLKSYIDKKFDNLHNFIMHNKGNIKPSKKKETIEVQEKPEKETTSRGGENITEEPESEDDQSKEPLGKNGFVVYLTHKIHNQTTFMGKTEGEYEDYQSASNKKFDNINEAKAEVDDMKNNDAFNDFIIGICAVTEDGPKFLKDDEIAKLI